jgi:nucleoid-associated protein YgaU
MRPPSARALGVVGLLIAVWIVTYWAWTPAAAPILSFAERRFHDDPPPADSAAAPALHSQPRFYDYEVRAGDTFESISELVYGTRAHADDIRAANPFVSGDRPGPAGRTIRLPEDPAAARQAGVPPQPVQVAPPPGVERYTIRAGDTLSSIARRIYGSALHAERIYRANRDVLDSMDALGVGQILVIPRD